MTTAWWLIVVWVAFDAGFLAGCAWVASRRPAPKEITIYVPVTVRMPQSILEPETDERFDWKSGIGVP